jgi:hypothetical protein
MIDPAPLGPAVWVRPSGFEPETCGEIPEESQDQEEFGKCLIYASEALTVVDGD